MQWLLTCECGRFLLANNQEEAEARWLAGESDA
jgi:hypothetical protein